MTWISAPKPQRKIPCVCAGPPVQPLRGPADEAWEAAAQPGPNWTGERRAGPPTLPSLPVVGQWACPCLSGGAATCVARVVQPDRVSTLSSWREALSDTPRSQVPLRAPLCLRLAVEGEMKGECDRPTSQACPVSVLLNPSDHSCKCQRAQLPAQLPSPECAFSALKQPTRCSHPVQFSDPDWLPLLSSGFEFQMLHR